MSCYFCRLSLVAALWAGFAWQVGAQEAPASKEAESKEPATEAVTATDIPKLIKQLDSEDFAERQAASSRLAGAAEMAIPALEKAALGESREASMRAFDILRNHLEKGGPTARDAAKDALERIAKADAGGASRRATEILTPPTPVAPPRNVRAGFAPAIPIMPAPGFAPAPGGIRIAGARIVVAAGAAGGGIETKIKVENGVKTTEVKDKDRQVKIVDDPDKGLQLEVTETKDGKEKTEKYEAKNADELKTKHPEAHKIYEEYSAKAGGIKIGGFGAIPGGIGGAVPADVEKMREEMKKRTAEMRKDMEKRMEESKQRSEEMKREIDKRFEESRKRAEETRRVLEGLRPVPAPAPAPPAPEAPAPAPAPAP
jgi:hypothetical protein